MQSAVGDEVARRSNDIAEGRVESKSHTLVTRPSYRYSDVLPHSIAAPRCLAHPLRISQICPAEKEPEIILYDLACIKDACFLPRRLAHPLDAQL